MAASRFDREYYDRFYRDPRTRVTSPADTNVLVAFVAAYLQHIGQPVRRVLDLGCGIGLWRKPLATHFPRARYVGVEISDYLCTKFGWQRGSAVDYRADEPFDLVICQGVLQYLTDKDARRALANLTRLVRGAVYVEALTKLDWRMHCDRERTDGAVRLPYQR